ncbi:SDR family NAD(P)-dependent oxidoreductase [Nocardia bovistercoris]|uniref:SDR family oxidoreductase n=1 Tax=Nocardia bovistercoris TaxID=2785916 RepID=A0A931N705_9NOCA|nr:SDR family oxidoreductase [Nocardia bovistercoris]MBH0780248.1 SDR family oxidoreductase [Nocardia bovistercoris]
MNDERVDATTNADTPAADTPTAADPDESAIAPRRSRRVFVGLAAAATGAAAVTAATTLPAYLTHPPTAPLPAAAPGARYADKVVLVTGATSGIGAATARAFAAEGASVVFCGRRAHLGREIERSLPGSVYVRTDVRVAAEVEQLLAEVDHRFGRLDIAVNNAGISRTGAAHEMPVAEFDDVFDTNVRGAFLALKYEVPLMLRSGGGVVLCTTSQSRRPGGVAYSASKTALQAMVAAASMDYGAQGIRVNAIAPGTTDTALVRPDGLPDPLWHAFRDAWGPLNVAGLGRMATPEEIARAILGLCSDDFGYMTGSTVLVGGGPFGGAAMRMPPGLPG